VVAVSFSWDHLFDIGPEIHSRRRIGKEIADHGS
jgi:hypothetical protein